MLLRRCGWQVNIKKTCRIYRRLGLQLRNRHPKRRVKAQHRDDRRKAVGPNQVPATDFEHDQLALGKQLQILTVVDTHSRYSLLPAHGSPTAARTSFRRWKESAARTEIRRRPGWTTQASSSPETSYSGPRPTLSCSISPGTANPQTTALSRHSIASPGGAPERPSVSGSCRSPRKELEAWRRDYNGVRPCSEIGVNVPICLHVTVGATNTSP